MSAPYDFAATDPSICRSGVIESPRPADLDPAEQAAEEFGRALESDNRRGRRSSPTRGAFPAVLRGPGYRRSGDERRGAPPTVRVNRGGTAGERIRAALTRLGGIAVRSQVENTYQFDSEARRDDAMDRVRSGYGWTSVDPL